VVGSAACSSSTTARPRSPKGRVFAHDANRFATFPAFSFGSELKAGTLPAVASQIRALTLLAPGYIRDPQTVQHLKELRQWIDNVSNAAFADRAKDGR
jgi:hypothetical protein